MAPSVADFFADRCVLVTGASGFLGKVLVEKLLWSIPNIGTVYLVIRPQNGLDPKQRLDKLLQSNVFDRLRDRYPDRLQRLVAIGGNLMEPELALSQPDLHRLCDDVSVVFHCAATVKFDEALRISVEMNVLGTQRLIAVCHKMRHLVSIVHASTAYANCDRPRIVESVYPPPVQPSKLIDALEWMNDDMITALTPQLLGRRPNTYTLTKALAEVQIVEDGAHLPIVIVRPSIIGAVWKEPIPGWTDNLNGPTGIFAAVGKGLLTNMCGNVMSTADLIPVDVVSNLMIVAAWSRANTRSDQIPVIHCCSGRLNPIKWDHICNYVEVYYRQYPLEQCYRVPSTHFHSSRLLFEANYYLKHHVPAYIIDFLAMITGRKPKFVRIYRKVRKMVETLHYFTTRGWDFQTKAMVELWETTSPDDQQTFNFDIRQLKWEEYLFDYLMGTRRYVLHEDIPRILPAARSNLIKLRIMGAIVNAACWQLLIQLFARKRPRHQKWFMLLAGMTCSHLWMNFWGGRAKIIMPQRAIV